MFSLGIKPFQAFCVWASTSLSVWMMSAARSHCKHKSTVSCTVGMYCLLWLWGLHCAKEVVNTVLFPCLSCWSFLVDLNGRCVFVQSRRAPQGVIRQGTAVASNTHTHMQMHIAGKLFWDVNARFLQATSRLSWPKIKNIKQLRSNALQKKGKESDFYTLVI